MKTRAFTLVEVLVACAMLAGLVLLLATLLDGLGTATRGMNRKLDASAQARIALNQMGRDLGSITTGAGATLVLGRSPDATGINDSMALLTRARGRNTATNHRLLAVFFAVRNYSDNVLGVSTASLPLLGRGFGSVPWQNTGGTQNSQAALDMACAMAATDVNGTAGLISNRAVIADGVIRMAVVLQLQDGRLIPFDPANPSFPHKTDFVRPGVTLPPDARAVDLSKVSAILVGLAVLDQQTRTLAATDLASIAAKLPRPAAGQTPVQAWDFNDPSFANSFSDVPEPVRQGLRFYQRSFPIPSP
jgi:type II secretory pathway pseudopilin PulG